jgi:phenylpropionate dioxygenase-like ring-hydroxylating dioxygenase large terminal subunit
MLSVADNEYITRVGPGTPMGTYLRRYWTPFMESSQLPERDGDILDVTLLGERLIAFRDSSGRVGLVNALCPHRSAPLSYARNEENGIRCIYHGWKFDVDGTCLDMPSEPAESNFKDKVKVKSYPVEERGGVLFAYLGPADKPAEMPDIEWTNVPGERRMMAHFTLECNWVQNLEGDVDSSHVGFLHANALRSVTSPDAPYQAFDKAPYWFIEQTDYGMALAARRGTPEGDTYYWRINQWLLPYYTLVASNLARTRIHSHIWVPLDDTHTEVWCVEWTTDGTELTERERWSLTRGPLAHIPTFDPETHTLKANAANHYLQDRLAQKSISFSGIEGIREQDGAMVEGMGAIVDRTAEHLGTSDTAVITLRRRLLQDAKDLANLGQEPFAATHGSLYAVRSWSALVEPEQRFPESAEMRELATARG